MIAFFIPIEVLAKQGDRTRIAYKWGPVYTDPTGRKLRRKIPYVSHHPDPDVARNATRLAFWAAQHAPPEPYRRPVQLDAIFIHPYLKKDAKAAGARAAVWNDVQRHDRDNLLKQLQDVLERCGFVSTDGRFVAGVVRKLRGPMPGVYVRLCEPAADPLPAWCRTVETHIERMLP